MIEIFILSLIQGITEFLPISSSSHLIIISNYSNFENQSLVDRCKFTYWFFLAVLTYFYKDIINFIKIKNFFLKFNFFYTVMLLGFF